MSATLAQLCRHLQNGAMLPGNMSALTADRRFRADALASSAPPPPASEALNWTASVLPAVLPAPPHPHPAPAGPSRPWVSTPTVRPALQARVWASQGFEAGLLAHVGSIQGRGKHPGRQRQQPRHPPPAGRHLLTAKESLPPCVAGCQCKVGTPAVGGSWLSVPPASQLPRVPGCAAWGGPSPAPPRRHLQLQLDTLQPTAHLLPFNSLPQELCNCGKQCACCPSPAGERCEACRLGPY